MPRSTTARRLLAVTASVGATAALALAPSGAYAGVSTFYGALGSADASYEGPVIGGSCDLSAGNQNPATTPVTFSGDGTKKASLTMDATFTNDQNTADTVRVRGHIDSKLSVDKLHKDLRSFDFGAAGGVKIIHSLSTSDCAGSGSVFGFSQMQFTEHHKGWFSLTRDTSRPNSVSIFALVNKKNDKLVTFELFAGDKSHSVTRALLKPGTYLVEEMELGFSLSDNGGGLAKSATPAKRAVSFTSTLHGEFKRIS